METEAKTITPTQVLEMRRKLVAQFGEKIINTPLEKLTTDEEKAASAMYHSLTEELHKVAPGTIAPDRMMEFYARHGVENMFELVWNYLVKFFWVIFAVAALLAVLKFVVL